MIKTKEQMEEGRIYHFQSGDKGRLFVYSRRGNSKLFMVPDEQVLVKWNSELAYNKKCSGWAWSFNGLDSRHVLREATAEEIEIWIQQFPSHISVAKKAPSTNNNTHYSIY